MSVGEWPSVIRRAVLAQSSDAPAFGFTYQYQLPTDPKFLQLFRLNEDKLGDIDYKIEGGMLLTDESTVSIIYGAYITDPESYDIYLRQSIVDRLVAELIYAKSGSLTNYKTMLEYCNAHANDLLSKAGVQTQSKDLNSDTFIDERR